MNLSHMLRQQARRRPGSAALIWRERQWTWAELNARVDAFASALAAHGVVKGDRVLVHSKNCHQLIESQFACFRLGAVWVPTNWRLTPPEVAYFAQSSGAIAMICHQEGEGHVATVLASAPGIRNLIAIESANFGLSYEDLLEQHSGHVVVDADVTYDDPCWFFYTSGTTGRPKAAVLTHGQMAFVVTNHIADLMPGLSHDDTSLVVAPLTHGAGVHQLVQIARGATTVLLSSDRMNPEEVWSLVERWRISNLFAVPTIVKILIEDPAVDRFDHSSLKHIVYAGAPMYRADQKHALQKLGKVLVQYFGLGEVTGNITVLPAPLHVIDDVPSDSIGSCGYERTGMRVSIQDPDGHEVATGESGEICVCGPAVFAGYFEDPDANAKAFRNGWFRTGDLGWLDAEGFLTINGRLSDMYISGGSNVYPREIEERLLRHPAVAEASVVGVPDARWGEVGWAVIVRRQGALCEPDELLELLGRDLARYKLPKRIVFWGELPKTGYGKISKKNLREMLLREAEAPL
jgi:acyl-CoA synthetase (AMP-forming)/AMP-acid ligase II